MKGACLHCQMDASAEMPALSTAGGGRSKRFIIACASQFRSGQRVCITKVLRASYWAGLFTELISWERQACQHSHMAAEMTGFSSASTLHACTEVCMGRAGGFCLPLPVQAHRKGSRSWLWSQHVSQVPPKHSAKDLSFPCYNQRGNSAVVHHHFPLSVQNSSADPLGLHSSTEN